jgi:hypothetical protein
MPHGESMNQRTHLLAAAVWVAAGMTALGMSPAAAQPYYPPPPRAPAAGYGYYPPAPVGYAYGRPYECDRYARDHAHYYAPQGAGVGRGAVRGAVGGAVFGAIVGGSKGARRGAMAGGGLGAVAAGARAQQEREYVHRLAYDDCMSGFRR